MDIDYSKIGKVSVQLMEQIEKDVASLDSDEEIEIGDVMILVEVKAKDEDGKYSYISWSCSEPREWIQKGMLHAGLESMRLAFLDDDEEDSDGEG